MFSTVTCSSHCAKLERQALLQDEWLSCDYNSLISIRTYATSIDRTAHAATMAERWNEHQ